jgi:hypothetical protein
MENTFKFKIWINMNYIRRFSESRTQWLKTVTNELKGKDPKTLTWKTIEVNTPFK